MKEVMPRAIADTVNELLARGNEVWLIGSRANPRDRPANDWDLLVFGSEELLMELRERPSVENLDLLVVFDGDNFESPWVHENDGATKRGDLVGWHWKRLGPDAATYRGTKAREGEDFCVDVTTNKAVRLGAIHAA